MFEHTMSEWLRFMELAREEGWLERKTVGGKTFGDVIPSPPDTRDWPLYKLVKVPEKVPDRVNFDYLVPEILDQGSLGSCVGKTNTMAVNMGYNYKQKKPPGGYSTMYNYALCKEYDGIPHQEGTYPRISCKISQKYGNLQQKYLPYVVNGLPHIENWMHDKAEPYKVKAYARLQSVEELEQAMSAGKVPRIAILVAENFVNWDGKEPIGPPQGRILGFHEMAVSSYDRKKGFLRGPNSWGTRWGKDGFYELSYEFCNWESTDLPNFPALREIWVMEFEELLTPKSAILAKLFIDDPVAIINGEKIYVDPDNLEVTPSIVDGRTRVPLRFIHELVVRKAGEKVIDNPVIDWFPKGGKTERIIIEI